MSQEETRFPRRAGTWFLGKFKRADLILFFLWLAYVAVFATLSLLQHFSIGTGLDLAIYDQYVWQMSIGHFLENTIVGASVIWNFYFAPLLVVFVPFYALWANSATLLVLQTILLSASVFPIYWYARSQVGRTLGLILAATFLLYPVMENVNLINFHVISLTVPLGALALFFLFQNQTVPFLGMTILLLLVKEEALFLVMGLGLYLLFQAKRRTLGIGLVVVSSLWFLLLMTWVFPNLFGRNYFAGREGLSGDLGTTIPDIFSTVLYQSDKVLHLVLNLSHLAFIITLMAPLAFVPLAGADVLLIVLPIFGISILTSTLSTQAQYSSSFVACLFFAAIVGLRRIVDLDLKRLGFPFPLARRTRQVGLGFILGFATLTAYQTLAPGPLAQRFDISHYTQLEIKTPTFQQILERVPRDAVVVAQEELLPQFSARRFIYSFPVISDYRRVDYWVAKRDLFFFDFHHGIWNDWVTTGYFDPIIDRDNFILYQRKVPQSIGPYRFGDGLTLRRFSVLPASPLTGGMTLRPIAEWQADKSISEKYSMTLQVVDRWGHVWTKSSGEPMDGAMPTDRWQVGKSIGDQYTLTLPPTMPTDDYQIVLSVQSVDGVDLKSNGQGEEIVVAALAIQKNKESIEASQLQIGQRLYVDMREMRLLGFELNRSELKSNDEAQLGIYWRARSKPQGDYLVVIRLTDAANQVVFQHADRPAKGNYPTTEWSAGEVLLDWHDWTMPTLPPGKYFVHASLIDGGEIFGDAELTTITVAK